MAPVYALSTLCVTLLCNKVFLNFVIDVLCYCEFLLSKDCTNSYLCSNWIFMFDWPCFSGQAAIFPLSPWKRCATLLSKLLEIVNKTVILGRKKDLMSEEKTVIIKRLGDGKSTLEIAKMTGRDHRTVKKYWQIPRQLGNSQIRGKWKLFQNVSCPLLNECWIKTL